MSIGSLFVTFCCAVLYGILRVAMEGDAFVVLFLCIPVTLICTIVGLIKSEGKTKLLVIPAQILIWVICAVLGVSIFKLMLAIVIILVVGGAAIYFLAPMFSSDSKKSEDTYEEPARVSFSDQLPDELIDEDGYVWVRDYKADNESRYHCPRTGQSTELFEGNTQVYNQTLRGSDGREYHWH